MAWAAIVSKPDQDKRGIRPGTELPTDYHPPVLRQFGAVGALTQSGTVLKMENQGHPDGNNPGPVMT